MSQDRLLYFSSEVRINTTASPLIHHVNLSNLANFANLTTNPSRVSTPEPAIWHSGKAKLLLHKLTFLTILPSCQQVIDMHLDLHRSAAHLDLSVYTTHLPLNNPLGLTIPFYHRILNDDA
jgi:hypothetical protein